MAVDQGTPEIKDQTTPVGNPLRYPRRIVLQLLQSAFAEEHLVTPETDNPYLYKKNADGGPAEDSKIVIADGYTDELTRKEPRPMIIVTRGDFGFLNLSIGGKLNTVSYRGGLKEYVDGTEMPLIINCVARRDMPAEEIAWIIAGFFRFFKTEIRRRINVFKLGDPRVGAPIIVKADSQADLFLVPVSFMVQQTMKWNVIKPMRNGTGIIEVYLKGEDEPFLVTDP